MAQVESFVEDNELWCTLDNSCRRGGLLRNGSCDDAVYLYRSFQRDVERFVNYFDTRASLGDIQIGKIEHIIVPRLILIRDYFEEQNMAQRVPVSLPQVLVNATEYGPRQTCRNSKV